MTTRRRISAVLLVGWLIVLGLLVLTVLGYLESAAFEMLVATLTALPLLALLYTLAHLELRPRGPGLLLLTSAGAQLAVLAPLIVFLLGRSSGWELTLRTFGLLLGALTIAGFICSSVLLGLIVRGQKAAVGLKILAFLPLGLSATYSFVALASFLPLQIGSSLQAVEAWFMRSIVVGIVLMILVTIVSLLARSSRDQGVAALGAAALVQLATLAATSAYSLLFLALRDGT